MIINNSYVKGGFWEDSMRLPIGTNKALRHDCLGREKFTAQYTQQPSLKV